jgi:hypothetical protein
MDTKSPEELPELIRHGGETTAIETKLADRISDSILETVSAFSNEPELGGGYLLLGVENKGAEEAPDYRVSGVNNAEKLEPELATQCRNEMNFPVRPQIRREKHGDKLVVIAYIPEAEPNDRPVYIRKRGIEHGTYRRIGPTDQRCTKDDLAVLFQYRDHTKSDAKPLPGTSMQDVDGNALNEYRKLKKNTLYARVLLALSDTELLKCLNAVAEHQGRTVLTLAGLVLFGKFTALRRHLPMMRLDYIRVEGRQWVKDPASRHESVEKLGQLFLIIPELISLIVEDMPRKFSLREDQIHREGAPLIPTYAIREAIDGRDKWRSRGFNPTDKAKPRGFNPLDGEEFHPMGSEAMPEHLADTIAALGRHAAPQALQDAIIAVCNWQPHSAQQLANLSGRNVTYLQSKYLQALKAAGYLQYLYPENPAHPRQAYRADARTGQVTKRKDGAQSC